MLKSIPTLYDSTSILPPASLIESNIPPNLAPPPKTGMRIMRQIPPGEVSSSIFSRFIVAPGV